jgi:prepilin-type N-terminal cleavage/methylation domain-containing protein
MLIKRQTTSGFTMLEIMIVAILIALLAAIAIPGLVHARATSQKNTCISNLRQIDSAVQSWAMENKKISTDTYTLDDVKTYINRNPGVLPECPSGGTYNPGATVSDPPTCTISGHALGNS